MSVPIVAESDLETLPEGVYLVGDGGVPRQRLADTVYDIENDAIEKDVVLVCWARVRPAGLPLPTTVEARVRADGRVLLMDWASGPA